MPLLAILAGSILAWCGFNGLSAATLIDRTMRGLGTPQYQKGSGVTNLLGPLLGFELAKAAVSGGGLTKLLGSAGGGGGEGQGEGEGEGEGDGEGTTPPEDIPPVEDFTPFDFGGE
jgi:hypothetical protein